VVRSVRRAQAIPRSGGSVSVVAHAGPPGDGRVADQGGDRLYRVNASLYPVEPAGILEERRLAPVPAAVPDGRTELSVGVGGCRTCSTIDGGFVRRGVDRRRRFSLASAADAGGFRVCRRADPLHVLRVQQAGIL